MHYSVNSQIESSYISARQFLLCETCFWTATIFKSTQKDATIINSCPVCSSDNVATIPLTDGDVYELFVGPKGGLEIKFSRANKL